MNIISLYTSFLITATFASTYASDLSTSINAFSNKLQQVISTDDNLIFSPFSAHSSLSLIYQGAAGITLTNFQQVLNLPDENATAVGYKSLMDTLKSAKNVQVDVANKIYLQNGYKLKENFRFITENYFDAGVDTTDFSKSAAAANEINNWVKNKTHNKIDKLFEPDDFDSDTQAVLLNAIYFKGNWLLPFDKKLTQQQKFYVSDEKFIMHPMMFQKDYYDYAENAELDAKILKMEYEDQRFAMIIVLPNSRTGIIDLEQKLSSIDLNTLKTTKSEEKVLLRLPKFKIESTLKLKNLLEKINLGNIFTNAANFSNLIEGETKLKVDKAVQKTYIEVNEEGAEAAVATGIEFVFFSGSPSQPIFRADHPFMFYITAKLDKESSAPGIILFAGKILSPTYEI